MKRVRHSRSGLFLIELMICILFFSITAGICIQFFVKSHNMSQDAKNSVSGSAGSGIYGRNFRKGYRFSG
mgnify:CR=1 FL=1